MPVAQPGVSTLNNVVPSDQGQVASSAQEAQQLQNAGFHKCYNPVCDFHIHPDRLATHDEYDTFDCPSCQKSYNLLEQNPFSSSQGAFTAGGGTIVGLSLKDQGQIAENLVKALGELPGYGPITWWSDTYHSPLDGGTAEWGIEVKAVCIDAKNHRFVPGRPPEKVNKMKMAEQMGYKGVLGVLVILDYRRSVADIYVREMPVGRGMFAFRPYQGTPRFLEEVPFRNPFLEPDHPAPTQHEEEWPF